MLSRAEILNEFGLPNCEKFEIGPQLDNVGIWRISVSGEGDPAVLMGLGHAEKFAAAIGSIDADLAVQVEESIRQARMHLRDKHRSIE